jgi:dolichyl-phosphate-mannose-protein mannosyltransferase
MKQLSVQVQPPQQEIEAESATPALRRLTLTLTPAQEWWLLGGILVIALIVRLLFVANPGFFNDVEVFVKWGRVFDDHPQTVYALLPGANYPPLAMYFCWFGVKAMEIVNPLIHQPVIYSVYASADLPFLEKIPVLLGDLAFTAAIYRIARRSLSIAWSLGLTLAYAFSPAVIYIGAVWGQLDTIFAIFLVLAFWSATQRQSAWVGIWFALALLVKPQPLILTPVLAIFLWRDGWRALRTAGIALAATGAIFCAPYLIPPHIQIFTLLHNIATSVTGATSSYAYNLWWAVGRGRTPVTDPVIGPLSAGIIGWACFFAVLAIICYGIWRAPKPFTLILGGAVVMYAFFVLTTGQHERYLFPVLPLLLLAAIWQRRYLAWYGAITLLCWLNLLSSVAISYQHNPLLGQPWVTGSIALANICCFGVLLYLFIRDVWPEFGLRSQATPEAAEISEAH